MPSWCHGHRRLRHQGRGRSPGRPCRLAALERDRVPDQRHHRRRRGRGGGRTTSMPTACTICRCFGSLSSSSRRVQGNGARCTSARCGGRWPLPSTPLTCSQPAVGGVDADCPALSSAAMQGAWTDLSSNEAERLEAAVHAVGQILSLAAFARDVPRPVGPAQFAVGDPGRAAGPGCCFRVELDGAGARLAWHVPGGEDCVWPDPSKSPAESLVDLKVAVSQAVRALNPER